MNNEKENQKPGKRFRNPNNHTRNVNKMNRNRGLEYKDYKGVLKPGKKCRKTICMCRKSCHITIPESEQRNMFDAYWHLDSWSKKTTFLLNHIESVECKKRRPPEKRKSIQFKKNFRRSYFFEKKEETVCKLFFKNVLQISETRIEKCVKKKQNMSSTCATDLRGKHSSHPKTPSDRIRNVISFINSLPQYESHYVRASNQSSKNLAPNLNMKIVYEEYKFLCR